MVSSGPRFNVIIVLDELFGLRHLLEIHRNFHKLLILILTRAKSSDKAHTQTRISGIGCASRADVAGALTGHLYQFAIQNRGGDQFDPGGLPLLSADPCARQAASSDPKLPCVISDSDLYTFSAPFQTPAFQNFVIYQAHVGSGARAISVDFISTPQ